MPGDHWPFNTRFEESQEGPRQSRNIGFGTRHPPQPGWVGRDCPAPCVTALLERLPRSCLLCVTEATAGGRTGAGWTGALVLYQRCYISVKGWGGEGVTGAMEVETPPSGQQMFLFVQSLLFFVFFFLVDGDSCEFSKGAIYCGRECRLQRHHSPPSLHPPGRLSPPQASCLCLPTSPPLKPSPLLELHPIFMAFLSVCPASSHWVSEHNFPAQSSFSP